jgi:hypothetical protein
MPLPASPPPPPGPGGAPAVTCEVWDGYCPPAFPPDASGAATWSLSVRFDPAGNVSCANAAFGARPDAIFGLASRILMWDLYLAGGAQVTNTFGATPPTTLPLASTPPVCRVSRPGEGAS